MGPTDLVQRPSTPPIPTLFSNIKFSRPITQTVSMARCTISQNTKIVSFQACAAGVQMINILSYYTMLDGQVDTEEKSKWAYYTGISIHLLRTRYILGPIGHNTCGLSI